MGPYLMSVYALLREEPVLSDSVRHYSDEEAPMLFQAPSNANVYNISSSPQSAPACPRLPVLSLRARILVDVGI